MTSSGNRETAFWRDTLGIVNPGWVVSLTDSGSEASMSEMDAAIYLFDSSTNQRICGVFSSNSMVAANEQMASQPNANEQLGDVLISLDASSGGLLNPTSAESAQQMLAFAMLYAATTRTFAHVMAKYACAAGHWVTVLYRFPEDGRIALRPGYQVSDGCRMLAPSELASFAFHLIDEDLRAGNQLLAGLINDSGMPALAGNLWRG